ncbi:unnamed protein product [Prorocentrum cordatum]|uniref:Uncharacterized protein n=1 Tax=Prorocentrum cordatum TaxID=2364126 RepID=A0ABN9X4R8_9DINO|nr:unnamed protein product [Polarella glacialis]
MGKYDDGVFGGGFPNWQSAWARKSRFPPLASVEPEPADNRVVAGESVCVIEVDEWINAARLEEAAGTGAVSTKVAQVKQLLEAYRLRGSRRGDWGVLKVNALVLDGAILRMQESSFDALLQHLENVGSKHGVSFSTDKFDRLGGAPIAFSADLIGRLKE